MVVGPEAPLADGIVDRFQELGIPIFGSTKAATEIESSKVFAKDLMQKYGIPCAQSASFSDYSEAKEYLNQHTPPMVVKADGLAAGKGVIVAESMAQAQQALEDIMQSRIFGAAGYKVIIEEHLSGVEMSAFAFSDGNTVVPMVPACDYKPVFDGNQGPNTGGMGSYSPPHFYNPSLDKTVMETVMLPTIKAMAQENRPYRGVLYGGLMLTSAGVKVLEFNARFGDPECQVTLPRLKTDLVDVIMAIINGKLSQLNVEWSEDACVGVVMASGGYPGKYETGFPITGLDRLDADITVFHAGTRVGSKPGEVLTSGGRVLTVTAMSKNLTEAREKVYASLPRIHFKDRHYRRDIAQFETES